MYTSHQVHALILVDPSKASELILKALRKAKMRKGEAASSLGCSHGTFLRWIHRLGIEERIERLQAQALREGWHFEKPLPSGRTKGSKDSYERTRRWKKAPKKRQVSVTPG